MLTNFFEKLETKRREKAYRRSQKLRAKNDKKPPRHQGWNKMINTGSGGLNRTENILAQKEFVLTERKNLLEDHQKKEK